MPAEGAARTPDAVKIALQLLHFASEARDFGRGSFRGIGRRLSSATFRSRASISSWRCFSRLPGSCGEILCSLCADAGVFRCASGRAPCGFGGSLFCFEGLALPRKFTHPAQPPRASQRLSVLFVARHKPSSLHHRHRIAAANLAAPARPVPCRHARRSKLRASLPCHRP